MNRKEIDLRIALAYQSIQECGLLEDGMLQKGWQGQIATFGAAVRNGSLLAAIAFFCEKGSASCDRPKILACIYFVLFGKKPESKRDLFEKVKNEEIDKKRILEATVAVKLAMQLFPMKAQTKEDGTEHAR